jgi:hypothetical protein
VHIFISNCKDGEEEEKGEETNLELDSNSIPKN